TAEAKELIEKLDEKLKADSKIQTLIQTLTLITKLPIDKAIELKKALVSEGIPERTATQLVDLLPASDTEFIAIAGSDPTLLTKKEKIMELIRKYKL
ncbi:hypothetical protein B9P99_01455, partial [Candidatus Marsarchaeota G1 archaeon OSP_B]